MGNQCCGGNKGDEKKSSDASSSSSSSSSSASSPSDGSSVLLASSTAPSDAPPASTIPSSSSSSSSSSAPSSSPPKLNPKDFMCFSLSNQTILRPPGSLQGQQFVIDGCKGCSFFLFDHSAALTIDDCEDCSFFIGPCEGSVFIRTSKRCRFIIAAQQLRLRECSGMKICLYLSAGQPVIEDTKDIQFGCFNCNYFGLEKQFLSAGLQPLNSEWSNIHDFHYKAEEKHWDFLDCKENADWKGFIEWDKNTSDVQMLEEGWVTPFTYGQRPHNKDSSCLVLINDRSAGKEVIYDFINRFHKSFPPADASYSSMKIIRSRMNKYQKQQLANILKENVSLIGTMENVEIFGMEINGEDIKEAMKKWFTDVAWDKGDQVTVEYNKQSVASFFEPIAV